MERLIIDTDVMIDILRRHPSAMEFLAVCEPGQVALSVLTLTELYAGIRSKEEMLLKDVMRVMQVIPVDEEIAIQAGDYKRRYAKSHGTGFADCVIAATAELEQGTLVTLNQKHFPMVKKKLVPYKKN